MDRDLYEESARHGYRISPGTLHTEKWWRRPRADSFSFRCVLYEMLTGKRAFNGANPASVIAAILERSAPPIGAGVPGDLDWIVRRCLARVCGLRERP